MCRATHVWQQMHALLEMHSNWSEQLLASIICDLYVAPYDSGLYICVAGTELAVQEPAKLCSW